MPTTVVLHQGKHTFTVNGTVVYLLIEDYESKVEFILKDGTQWSYDKRESIKPVEKRIESVKELPLMPSRRRSLIARIKGLWRFGRRE